MPPKFGLGTQRFIPADSHTPSSGSHRPTPPSVGQKTTFSGGLGKGKGAVGLGVGKAALKRHKKVHRDTIQGITKGDIRRLARRGGIKRISSTVYDSIRDAMRERLRRILEYATIIVESDPSNRKTVTVQDVIYSVSRLGNPLYGYDASFDGRRMEFGV
ncbi:hypothetical protein GRF29_154g1092991 [Pseudopithomyces chartarum]|uniref:Histone H4 n=1 Tax=Pseudopithomyces chartarum TaxID=1892770 RepID=A0AAN6LR05_9PLEO|nr:hypothetical protein GRF29_154g1092991 [Pseudopithomyces chartarum]